MRSTSRRLEGKQGLVFLAIRVSEVYGLGFRI